MRLHKVYRPTHGEFPHVVKFAGSQADARHIRLNMEEPFKALKSKDRPKVTVTELDIPTDKKGLIAALNELRQCVDVLEHEMRTMDEQLTAVGDALEPVDYVGSYADGIRTLIHRRRCADHSALPAFPVPENNAAIGVSTRLWVATQLLAGLLTDPNYDVCRGDDKLARVVGLADGLIEECNK